MASGTTSLQTTKVPTTLYLSFDVETTGDTPLDGSLVSIGIVGFEATTQEEKWHFKRNIIAEKNNPVVMERFWNKHPGLWANVQQDALPLVEVIQELNQQLSTLQAQFKLVWAASPAAFDWMWLKSAFVTANISFPFFKAECISSQFSHHARLNGWTSEKQSQIWETWAQNTSQHDALEDARAQGKILMFLLHTKA